MAISGLFCNKRMNIYQDTNRKHTSWEKKIDQQSYQSHHPFPVIIHLFPFWKNINVVHIITATTLIQTQKKSSDFYEDDGQRASEGGHKIMEYLTWIWTHFYNKTALSKYESILLCFILDSGDLPAMAPENLYKRA